MAEHRPRPRQFRLHPPQTARPSNLTSPSHDGGAPAAGTAFASDLVLTGLHTPLGGIHTEGDQNDDVFFSPSDPPFPDFSGSFVNFSHPTSFPSDYQASLSAATAIPSHHLDVQSSSVDIDDGVHSHRTDSLELSTQSAAPWSHLAATEGSPPELPTEMDSQEQPEPLPLHPSTPGRRRAASSASGHQSLRDSAYWTGSGKSQLEIASIAGGQRDSTDLRNAPLPATPYARPQMHTYPSSQSSSTVTPGFTSSQLPSESGQSTSTQLQQRTRPTSLRCPDPTCPIIPKTYSELKKHLARHARVFTCSFPGCGRQTRGFATSNDLDRHLKSLHSVNNRSSKYYKCCADGCTKANKRWPRLDNFKAHLQKMHATIDTAHLLRLSDEWYIREGQGDQSVDTVSNPDGMSDTAMPVAPGSMASQPPRQEYQGTFEDHWQPVSEMHVDPQMSQFDFNFNTGPIDSALSPTTPSNPTISSRRRASNPGGAAGTRRPPIPNPHANTLQPPTMHMQRAFSQAGYSSFQDNPHFPPYFNNPMVNLQFTDDTPWAPFDPMSSSMRPGHPMGYKKRKGPFTVPGSDLNLKRMKDFIVPQEVQPITQDFGGTEEFLGFMGSSTGADDGTTSAAPSAPQINVFPPANEPRSPASAIERLFVDEIHSFLKEHASKADKSLQALSEQEIVSRIRLSLRSFDTMTNGGSSSMSRVTGAADSESPLGKTCPVTKDTYFPCEYPGCKKIKIRPSDLKKHMQRHSKPFGCTFDRCEKVFGSKNDWKRHEQGQHEQRECWRCPECHEILFHHQDNYVNHMLQMHSSRLSEDAAHQCLIARNYQGHFWCGFCNDIILHSKSGVDSTNDRFDHIANHFTKDKRSAKEWLVLGGRGKTKQDLADELKDPSQGSTKEDTDGSSETLPSRSESTQFSSSSQHTGSQDSQNSPGADGPRLFGRHSSSVHSSQMMMSSPRRMVMMAGNPQGQGRSIQSQRRHYQKHHHKEVPADFVICCQCGMSSSISLMHTCIDPCLHPFCTSCEYKVAKDH